MKKLLPLFLIAILSIASTSTLFAQDSQFGLRTGLNISSLAGDDSDDLDSKTGYHVGIIYNYVYNDKFAYEPGFTYSRIGAAGSDDSSGINLDYLYAHMVAKYLATENISIRAGIQYGFLLNAESPAGEDLYDFFKIGDFGLVFGAGYQFDFGLGFSFNYILGLTNIGGEIESVGFGIPTEPLDLSNRNIQLSVSYLFR